MFHLQIFPRSFIIQKLYIDIFIDKNINSKFSIISQYNGVRWLESRYSCKINKNIQAIRILPSIRDNSGNAELSTSKRAQFAMRWVSGVERNFGWTILTPGKVYRPIALVTAK